MHSLGFNRALVLFACSLAGCGGHYVGIPSGAAGTDTAGNSSVSSGAGGPGGGAGGSGGLGEGNATQSQPTGDAGASGGAMLPDTHTLPSSGCGKPLPAEQVSTIPGSRTGYTEWHVQLHGQTLGAAQPDHAADQQFFVRVPADYDPNRAYRVVYLGHGCGAVHAGATNTFPLFDEAQGGAEEAVYVGLSVPDSNVNPGCYDNNAGPLSQMWEIFDVVHTFVESHYCVDNDRIHIAGYSTGAALANQWACYFGGTPSPPLDEPDVAAGLLQRKFSPKWAIRGGARVAGFEPPNIPVPCNGPSAGFWLQDDSDKSNLISTSYQALNLALLSNGCTGNYQDGPKQPWAAAAAVPSLSGVDCQEYTGCPAEIASRYPLVFCTSHDSGHGDQAARAVPAFTRFFAQVDAAQ